ncbi:DUF4239 domain-containing protein [Nibricoccus sp. IMCC34717]|uniref:bestrophin-like domain n=1 Tax=Nibricoccus sp. IMCC34717 TaxID=3034021 RepID=UPI00384E6E74
MSAHVLFLLITGALIVLMFFALELGRNTGRRRLRRDPEWRPGSVSTIENAVLALLGLLIAFSFSGAWQRFDTRRQLILEEANAFTTAHSRLDFLSPAEQPQLRALFKDYLRERIRQSSAGELSPSADCVRLQTQLWDATVAAVRASGATPLTAMLPPAVNALFDVATARFQAAQTHPPGIVFGMLAVLTLLSAFLAGYGTAQSETRNWLHMAVFSFAVGLALHAVVELEFPREGWIRLDRYDAVLTELTKVF